MSSTERPDPSFLKPAHYIDSDHPSIQAFARETVGSATSDAEKASLLFRAVREKLRYDPYSMSMRPDDNVASAILTHTSSYCIPKAVLLAAAARAVGLPSRVGFSDVKNHLSSKKLLEHLGTDLFVYHGYTEVWVDGHPYKLTPAFNEALCDRFGVKVMDFDAKAPADALLQPFDGAGRQYMQYVADHGLFVDLPFEEIMTAMTTTYPSIMKTRTVVDEAFQGS